MLFVLLVRHPVLITSSQMVVLGVVTESEYVPLWHCESRIASMVLNSTLIVLTFTLPLVIPPSHVEHT
jgi:hypothetical protein